MTLSIDKKILHAKKKAKLAKLEKQEMLDKRITKFVAQHDSLDSGNDRKRKSNPQQRGSTDNLIDTRKRAKGAAAGRGLHENNGAWKGIMQQFRVAVVGANGPKLQVNLKAGSMAPDGSEYTEDDQLNAKLAAGWFNGIWAKDCDQNDDTPLAEMVANCLITTKQEGDLICVFDDFLQDDGRLRWFESTQIVPIEEGKWEDYAKTNGLKDADGLYVQDTGLVMTSWGKVMGFIVTPEHGKLQIEPATDRHSFLNRYDAREPDAASAKLIKSPWRFNQHRGDADALTVSNQQQDIYEMLAAELQTAKKASQIAGWLTLDKDADSGLNGLIKVLTDQGKDADEIDAIINGDGSNAGMVGISYDSLDGLCGGKFDYMQPGEKPEFFDSQRPNMNVTEFCEWIQVSTGHSMGVGRARATGKAETSYTAFRGEELMTWQTFEWDQKFLERRLMDFLAVKALRWAIRNKTLPFTLPDGWEFKLSFAWPKMREVNELVTQQAIQLALKNGTADFSQILGPDWEEKFEALGLQLSVARMKEIPLSTFETVSGTVIEENSGEVEEPAPVEKETDDEEMV